MGGIPSLMQCRGAQVKMILNKLAYIKVWSTGQTPETGLQIWALLTTYTSADDSDYI